MACAVSRQRAVVRIGFFMCALHQRRRGNRRKIHARVFRDAAGPSCACADHSRFGRDALLGENPVLAADIMQHGAGDGAVAVCQIDNRNDIPRMDRDVVAQMKDHQNPPVSCGNRPVKQAASAHFVTMLVYQILRFFSNAGQVFSVVFEA